MDINNNGNMNQQPKGFSLDEILAEVKASKERARAELQKQQAEAESKKFQEEQRIQAESARREAEERVLAENEFRARIEREQKSRVEAEVKAKLELEQRRRKEIFEKQYAEKQRKLREEAEIRARIDAERRLKEEEETRLRIEREIKHRAETEYRAKIEAEYRAKIEAATQEREEAVRQAREEAEARILAVTEAKARAEVMAKAKLEAEMRAKAEAEMHAKIEAEIRSKAEAEARARIEAAEKEEAEFRAIADEEARKLNLIEEEIHSNKIRKNIFEFSLDAANNENGVSDDEFISLLGRREENTEPEPQEQSIGESDNDLENQLLFVRSKNNTEIEMQEQTEDEIVEEPVIVESDEQDINPVDQKRFSLFGRRKKKPDNIETPIDYKEAVSVKNDEEKSDDTAEEAPEAEDASAQNGENAEQGVKKNENQAEIKADVEEKANEIFAEASLQKTDTDEKSSPAEVMQVNDSIAKKAEEKLGEVSEKIEAESVEKLDIPEEKLPELDESRKQSVEDLIANLGEKMSDGELATTPLTSEEKLVLKKSSDTSEDKKSDDETDKKNNKGSEKNQKKFEYEGDFDEEKEKADFKKNLNALFNGDVNPIAADFASENPSPSSKLKKYISGEAYLADEEDPHPVAKSENHSENNDEPEISDDDLKSIKAFLSGENQNKTYDDGDNEEIPGLYELDEYFETDNKDRTLEKINSNITGGLITAGLTVIITIFSAVISLAPGLPGILSPRNNYSANVMLNIFILIVVGILSYKEVIFSLKSIMRKKITAGFPAVLALILSFLYHITAFFADASEAPGLFTVLPVFALTLCNTADLLNLFRVRNNFDFMTSGSRYAGSKINKTDIINFVESQTGVVPANLVGSKKAKFIENFFEMSLKDTETARITQNLSIVALCGIPISFAVSVICGLGVAAAFGVAVAVYVLSSPVFLGFVTAFQLIFSGREHLSNGAAVVGAQAVKAFGKTNSMVIDASELFKEGTVSLDGIKVFENIPVDEALTFAAAAASTARSPLAQVFLSILQDDIENLPKVETLHYKDDMGLVCTIGGRQILVGNSDLMRSYGINTPTKEMENRVEKGVRKIVYVSVDNKLALMVAVIYGFDENVFWRLHVVNACGVNFAVLTPDANITAEFLEREVQLRQNSVVVVPTKLRVEYIKEQNQIKTRAGIIHDGTFEGYIAGVSGAMRLIGNLKILKLAQLIFSAIGFILPLFVLIIGGGSALTPSLLFIATMAFALLQMAVAFARKC